MLLLYRAGLRRVISNGTITTAREFAEE